MSMYGKLQDFKVNDRIVYVKHAQRPNSREVFFSAETGANWFSNPIFRPTNRFHGRIDWFLNECEATNLLID